MRAFLRWAVGALIVAHGLVHLLGAAKGLGWAEVATLTEPIGTAVGVLWLGAATLMVVSGAGLLARRVRWWQVGAAALVASQVAIASSWADAWAGTLANVVLLGAMLHGFAAAGPFGARAQYRRLVAVTTSAASAPGSPAQPALVRADELRRLPTLVAGYVAASGAVGKRRITGFRARISGRIRSGPDKPWMPFVGEQVNTFEPTFSRVLYLDATMAGLPTDVLHTFIDEHATMDVRLCSMVRVASVDGTDRSELDEAETVTLLNDLTLFAPAALLDAPIRWRPLDERRVAASFRNRGRTVHAELVFDQHGELVDFRSADRWRTGTDGQTFVRQRWSTPVRGRRAFDGRWALSEGVGRWHPEGAPAFDYLEVHLDDIVYLPARAASPLAVSARAVSARAAPASAHAASRPLVPAADPAMSGNRTAPLES